MDIKYLRNIVLFAAVLLMVFISDSCSYSLKATKKMLDKAKTESYDIIIVPGVPLENEKWSDVMKHRICWSKYLYDKGITKNVMYSGSAVYTPYKEGEVMALYAIALGIPAEHVFAETKAEHSTENAYYSYHKALKLGFKKIAFASDAFQVKMLSSFIRNKLSEDIGLLPVVSDILAAEEAKITDPVIDYKKAFVKDFIALPDRQGSIKRFLGTMGQNIDHDAYK
jgi:hypothetical protein